jgi:hypothetical protein
LTYPIFRLTHGYKNWCVQHSMAAKITVVKSFVVHFADVFASKKKKKLFLSEIFFVSFVVPLGRMQ